MRFRILFTITMGALMLFLLGCGGDDAVDNNNSIASNTDALGTITGKILNDNGNPVSGAIVTTKPTTSQTITIADGSYQIRDVPNGDYTVFAKSGDKEGVASVSVKKGGVTQADIRLTAEIQPEIRDGQAEPISIAMTFPKPNDKVDWRAKITGKLLGAKDLRGLKVALNLNPDDELKIRLWVWDANDPHGPWLQPPATIKNNLEWVSDEPAWFGREGNLDVGKTFNVKAELVKQKGIDFLQMEGVEPVTITNVVRK